MVGVAIDVHVCSTFISADFCVYNEKQYQTGQSWYDGCSYRCTCVFPLFPQISVYTMRNSTRQDRAGTMGVAIDVHVRMAKGESTDVSAGTAIAYRPLTLKLIVCRFVVKTVTQAMSSYVWMIEHAHFSHKNLVACPLQRITLTFHLHNGQVCYQLKKPQFFTFAYIEVQYEFMSRLRLDVGHCS